MTVTLQLTVKSCAPIALRSSRASEQFAQGLDYIPGSTLRGALAALYLRTQPDQLPDETFKALFLSEQVSYPDLLPTLSASAPGTLLPATAQACKRYKWDHPQSLADTLLRLATQKLELDRWEQALGASPEALQPSSGCPTCQELGQQSPLYHLTGYYMPVAGAPYTLRPIPHLYRRLIAGVSINRTTGTAEQGMLFSQDVLEEEQYFSGQVRLADDLAEMVLDRLKPKGILRVGYGRNRGLGKLAIVDCQPVSSTGPDLAERWQKFNDKAWATGLPSDRVYFSLTLESDWIRRDPLLYSPVGLPGGAELGLPEAERHRCLVHATTVMGWNTASRLPKESRPALKRGSVLLFSLPRAEEQIKAAQARLAEIEAAGLGDRRSEGFGRVSVCHPFHYETITWGG